MYFTVQMPIFPYEEMMCMIPNFRPRGHGIHIFIRSETKEDTECDLCCYFKRNKCNLDVCPFIKEKIKFGTATKKQIMDAVFMNIRNSRFRERLSSFIKESENKIMNYYGKKHESDFKQALDRTDPNNLRILSAVYLLRDEDGTPKHCHRRSTTGSFKQTEAGSQAEHSFHHNGDSEWLFVFEAPIDMLAFLSLHRDNWQKHSYVALCSVSERAILHRLKVNPKLKKIVLCLDNDAAGHAASVRIKELLQNIGYSDVRIHHPHNKDWDEDRKAQNGIAPIQAEEDQSTVIQQWCHDVIDAASRMKPPPMLYEKTMIAYTAMCNANGQPDKVGNFLMLLLMLAKDECRKCLAPILWDELEAQLVRKYISYADNGDVRRVMCISVSEIQKAAR